MAIQLEPFSSTELTPGLKRALSADKQLIIFTLSDYSADTIENWLIAAHAHVLESSPNRPVLIAVELAVMPAPNNVFEIRNNFDLIWEGTPEMRTVYAALISPTPLFVASLRLILQVARRSIPRGFMEDITAFGKRDEAIAWLVSQSDEP